MIPAAAWSMRDEGSPLYVFMVLVGNYFAIGTKWEEQTRSTTWLTRHFNTAEAAHEWAIDHTEMLERSGDTITVAPIAFVVPDPSVELALLVDRDQESELLDRLWTTVYVEGSGQ